MKLNKISLKKIDSVLEEDIEWTWWCEDYDLSKKEFKFIVDLILNENSDLKRNDIFIHWHAIVGEYCIYIKGKWSGYVDDWMIDGYKSFEDYYAFDNKEHHPILNIDNNFIYKK